MNRCLPSLSVLLALLICCSCTVWKERPAQVFSDATGGEELERMFWKEIKAKNWKEVESHVASNFMSITRRGALDRAGVLEYLKGLQLEDYSLGDFQTQLNGDTFVVVYTITLRGTLNGQPIPPTPRRVLTVWQQQKASWVAIAHSFIEMEPTS